MNCLNNNQTSGSDELPGELLKCRSEILPKPIADIFKYGSTKQHTLSKPGHVVIILLSKPGKPVGAMTSLKPIVLLNALKKTSLVVLAHVADKVDAFLSQGLSGFQHGRSTADVLGLAFLKLSACTTYHHELCI